MRFISLDFNKFYVKKISPYGQHNFGFNLDLYIEAKEETKANGTERLNKLNVAQ